ncbi:MAG: Urease accessory protein UreD, partial [uncultured Microvirga sp.]
ADGNTPRARSWRRPRERPLPGRRAAPHRRDAPRAEAASGRRKRRLPCPLPARGCLRRRADQHRRRSHGRGPHEPRRRGDGRRIRGPDHAGGRENLSIRRPGRRGRDRPHARIRDPSRLAAAGADPVRRRAASPQPGHPHGRGCVADPGRERRFRPPRDGRSHGARLIPGPLAHHPRWAADPGRGGASCWSGRGHSGPQGAGERRACACDRASRRAGRRSASGRGSRDAGRRPIGMRPQRLERHADCTLPFARSACLAARSRPLSRTLPGPRDAPKLAML